MGGRGRQLVEGHPFVGRVGLVDFWTEASLFSQAGLTAFVFGPGDIAQAHTADEWVALDQLDTYAAHAARIIGSTPA